jgi:hypothetical protein
VAGDIWWGDVVRTSSAMGVTTAAEFERVAALLGFGGPPPPKTGDTAAPARRRVRRPDGQRRHDAADAPDTGPVDESAPQRAAPTVLTPVAEERIKRGLKSGPVLARTPASPSPTSAVHQPLLSPRSTNGILHYLLSRLVPDGPADVEALLAAITAGRPPEGLPRRPRRTLRFGVEVLVDLSTSMRPFRRDQSQVVDSVRALVGATATRVALFADAPLRGVGAGPQWTWHDYVPRPGSRVLLLTDFGIGGDPLALDRGTPAEWRAFFRVLHRSGSQPVALVPYPPARWPGWLRDRCPLLLWDRRVTTGQARTVAP